VIKKREEFMLLKCMKELIVGYFCVETC
jgi:hypothetical protein